MYDITFNNETGNFHGVYVARRPMAPVAEEEVETFTIAGRDGVLTGKRRLLPMTVSIDFGFRTGPEQWNTFYRNIKKWLHGAGRLVFSDDTDWFYKVISVKITNAERQIRKLGFFTAEFTCDPYVYRMDGLTPVTLDKVQTITNNYEEAHPAYIIAPGQSDFSITINGNVFNFDSSFELAGEPIVVDTDRMLTYSQRDLTTYNNWFSGDYEDMYLKEGSNSFSCSSADVVVMMIPNWRAR